MKPDTISKPKTYFLTVGMNSLLLAAVCGLIFVLVRHHLSLSREFYFWDNTGYYNIAVGMLERFPTVSKLDFLRDIYHSFSDEISNLFAIPTLPLLALLGTSRQSFIMSLALCHLLPTVFLIAWLCSRYIGKEKLITFWGVTFILLLSPFCWSAILDGRPDMGGVGIILLAVAISSEVTWSKLHYPKYVLIGLFLSLALLMRRSFLIAVIAFGLAWPISEWVTHFRNKGQNLGGGVRQKIKCLTGPFLGLVAFLIFMLTLGYPFSKRYLLNGVLQSYSSYYFVADRGWRVLIDFIFSFFSIPLVILASLGLIFRFPKKQRHEMFGQFFILASLFTVVWILIWGFGKAPVRHNYMVVLLWVFIVGAVSFLKQFRVLEIIYRSRLRLVSSLALIFIFELAIWGKVTAPKYFVPEPIVPVVRQDYDSVLQMASDLRVLTAGREKVLVAGSSWIMNDGVLGDAEAQLVGRRNKILHLIGILHADSYKHIPIKEILGADWVVVPTPFQWHMHPSVQQCVQVLHDALEDRWEISQDFKKHPKEYFLMNGVRVELFHRLRKTDEAVARQTEEKMKSRILKDGSDNKT